jgi:hypothetical protein
MATPFDVWAAPQGFIQKTELWEAKKRESGRIVDNPSRIDAKRGDQCLQADFTGPIPPSKPDSFRLADQPGLERP